MLRKVLIAVGTLFVLALMIGLFGNSSTGQSINVDRPEDDQATVQVEQAQEKNVAQRHFGSKLTYYNEKDGVINIEYQTAQTTLRLVQMEIKQFMQAFMRERGDEPFEYVSILATTDGYDSNGKKQTVSVYKVEFYYEDAVKVDSWPFADVEKVGVVLYENPAWR